MTFVLIQEWSHRGHIHRLEARGEDREMEMTRIDGSKVEVSTVRNDPSDLVLEIDGTAIRGAVFRRGDRITVTHEGRTYVFERHRAHAGGSTEVDDGNEIASPMTGRVVKSERQANERVAAGDTLIVVEAMKMEHRLTAPRDALIAEVLVAAGAPVEIGQVLLRLAPPDIDP